MQTKHFRFLSLAFFAIGMILLLNSKINITGASIGISSIHSTFSSILGISFIIGSVILFVGGKSLEKRVLESTQITHNAGKTYDETLIKHKRDELLDKYKRGKIDETEFAKELNNAGEFTGGTYNPGNKQLSITIMGHHIKIPRQGTNSDLARAIHRRILANSPAYKSYCEFHYSKRESTKHHTKGLQV